MQQASLFVLEFLLCCFLMSHMNLSRLENQKPYPNFKYLEIDSISLLQLYRTDIELQLQRSQTWF